MSFRNLTLYRIPASVAEGLRLAACALDDDGLQAMLAQLPARPCGAMELASRGWVSPYGSGSEALFQLVGDTLLLTVGGEDKILPGAAVNAELAKRLRAIEEAEGQKLGGRARKRLKDDVVTELLPRALVKPYRLSGFIDLKRGLVVVDTASRKAGDSFVSHLRQTLGSFPALPINAEVAPRSVLTGWLAGERMPESCALGEECELRDPADNAGVVRVQRLDLQGDEIEHHLAAGKQCTRLGLFFDDRLEFTLGEDLVVRKFKLLEAAIESLEGLEAQDVNAELDARMALLAGEVGTLFDVLERALKLSKAEG